MQWPPSGAADSNRLKKIKVVTKNRSQINGSDCKPIVLNGNSQPPTAEFRLKKIEVPLKAYFDVCV